MKRPKSNSLKTKKLSRGDDAGRGGDRPALIRDDMLKECTDLCPNPNPFGIKVLPGFTLLTPEAIEHQYREIRRIFFAGFDPNAEWKLVAGYSPHYLAGVKYETKEIAYSVDLFSKPIVILNRALVHELCHAVLGPRSVGHGKRWRTRMEEAARVAEAIGHVELAEALRYGYANYDPDSDFYEPPLTAVTCYEAITRLVKEEPDWSFEDIMYQVGREHFVPDDQLIKKFKKCRQVFEKAKKQVKHAESVGDDSL
jgi:hypothetical protein